jgi:D-alanine-D-alanine ligase
MENQRNDLGKVAVLMGGKSAEREISLMSGQGVLQALRDGGIDAHAFDPAERDLGDLKREGFSRCFIALHGRYGEDGTVQGALELLGIPYTGSGVMASAIAMDKVMTKRIWRAEGLSTPAWQQVTSHAQTRQAFAALGAPMMVKPAREGSTIGMTKVTSLDQCDAAYTLASQHDARVLCEQFIDGIELTCPVLGPTDAPEAFPMIQIVAPGGNYDYQNKYFNDATQYLLTIPLSADACHHITQMACRAYQVLGCRGWARVDIMVDRSTGTPYLLEINTSPGMTSHSLVPMSAKAFGLGYEALCLRVLKYASLDAWARS